MLVSVIPSSGGKNHKSESYCFLVSLKNISILRARAYLLYCTVLYLVVRARAQESFSGTHARAKALRGIIWT